MGQADAMIFLSAGVALAMHLVTPWDKTIPARFLGRYADAQGSCSGASAFVNVEPSKIEWFGRRDRVIVVEPISEAAIHVFIAAPDAAGGVTELHFELQGAGPTYLLVLNHLSDAEDLAQRGSVIPDKSVIGFLQRCG
jgi:hypothetical protein